MKNKVLSLLLSLAVAFGLWLYVVTVISPESEETYYNIPVEVVGADQLRANGLILISDTKQLQTELTLRGNRADLQKLTSSSITVIADLSKISGPGEHQLECSVSAGAAEVISQNAVTVQVARQESKTIPVKVIYTGAVRTGYEADKDNVTMDHTTVTITGPKDTVDRIAYAGITVDLSDRMTSFVGEYNLTLYGSNSQPVISDQYMTMNLTQVSAVVPVSKVKKVSLHYSLDYSDSGLQEGMVTVLYTKEVTLVGSEEALALVEDQYSFTIKLSQYKQTTTQMLSLNLPEGVVCRDEIQMHISLPQMQTKQMLIHTQYVHFENQPDDWQLQLVQPLQLELWGPADKLAEVGIEDVQVYIDCTDVVPGVNTVTVRCTVAGYEYLVIAQNGSQVEIVAQQPEA